MICKHCGSVRMPVYSAGRGWEMYCPKCGGAEACAPVEGLESAAEAAGQGRSFFATQEFDEAERSFRRAAKLSGGREMYLWGALLARYGVKYCASASGRGGYAVNYWKPELPRTPLSKSADYRELCRAAAALDKDLLRALQLEAGEIDGGLAQIRQLEAEGKHWDVFLSFKDMGAAGNRTLERQLMEGVYAELLSEDVRVFFAPKTMAGKVVSDFEGYIYTALRTSKLLVLAGSAPENVNAPWVASEWERFARWDKRGQIVMCPVGEMRVKDFPEDLRKVQTPLAMGVKADRVNDPVFAKWIAGEVRQLCDKAPAEEERPPEPVERVEPPKRAKQPKTAKPPKPVERVESVEPPKPVEPVKPAEPPKRVEPLKWEEPPKPVEPVKRVEPLKWEEPPKPVEPPKVEGILLLRERAERGDVEAQGMLADCLYKGDGVRKDVEEAIRWYRRAANQNSSPDQTRLARALLESGGNGPEVREEAIDWLRKAIKNGDKSALYEAGRVLIESSKRSDREQAYQYFRRAAKECEPAVASMAMYRVGRCLFDGDDVEMDRAEAREWIQKAADGECKEAKAFLDAHWTKRGKLRPQRKKLYLHEIVGIFLLVAFLLYAPAMTLTVKAGNVNAPGVTAICAFASVYTVCAFFSISYLGNHIGDHVASYETRANNPEPHLARFVRIVTVVVGAAAVILYIANRGFRSEISEFYDRFLQARGYVAGESGFIGSVVRFLVRCGRFGQFLLLVYGTAQSTLMDFDG